jgi:hypothetical protein
MVVAVIAGVIGLLTVLLACYRQDATLDPPRDPDPGWEPLPAPNDVARPTFPAAFPGYDPAAVDATVEALLVAYEELWAAAPPDVRERARRSAARRRGVEAPAPAPPPGETEPPAMRARAEGAPVLAPQQAEPGLGHVPEARRAAAALGVLARAQQRS